jgi:uncharacterized protein YraI
MMSRSNSLYIFRRTTTAQFVAVFGAMVLTLGLSPPAARAQECTDCLVAAAVDLNVLARPVLEAEVLGIVPQGGLLVRRAGPETNRLVPVTVDGVSGWVIADGLMADPVAIGIAVPATDPSVATAQTAVDPDARVTLAPLMLRSAPTIDTEPILVIPEGDVVTLTWQGSENGFVTVDYGGVHGWAYADLLAETTDPALPPLLGMTTATTDTVAPIAAAPAPVHSEPPPVFIGPVVKVPGA